MGAHGLGEALGIEGGGAEIVAGGAGGLAVDDAVGLDAGDGGEIGHGGFVRIAPIGEKPGDVVAYPVAPALLHGEGVAWIAPFPRLFQAILALLGMPRAVKRLMQRTATAASTFWRSKVRERRLGPISVL